MNAARATLLLGLALVLGGVLFDVPPLYVPGIALALIAVVARLWTGASARATALHCRPDAWSIAEGDPWPLLVELRGGRLPRPGARFEHPLLSSAPAVGRLGRSQVLQVTLRFPHRGRWELGNLTVTIADPFGLHRRRVQARIGGAVLVLPRIEPLRFSGARGAFSGEELSGSAVRGESGGGFSMGSIDFEVDGLRPHQRGTPASRIHWPTVARTGELVEHRLLSGGESPPLVVLDTTAAGDEAVDRAVRAAASISSHLAREGGCGLLLPGEARPLRIDSWLRSWPEAHARLALVRPGGAPAAPARLAGSAAIFCVYAADRPPAWTAGTGGRGFLVGAALQGPAAFEVAGCLGVPIAAARRAPARTEAMA